MQIEHFQYIVIGGGSGGYAAARTAREQFEKVAIVDGAETLGGLCILRGCMPSKTLIYSSEVLYQAKRADLFGLTIRSPQADMPKMHRRKNLLINEFAHYRQDQLESDRFTLFRNRARFLNQSTIELDDGRRLSADYFMIATGSVAATPPIPGLESVPAWTSDQVLDLDFLPERIIVLGGGIVACELAQFLRRIGSEVTLIQRNQSLLKEMPERASEVIEEVFTEEGIEVHTDTVLRAVDYEDGRFKVTFEQDKAPAERTAPFLLNALGRTPATAGLNLEAAGIERRPSGHIACNNFQQTSNPIVYACGDVAGPHEIVHIAILQGETAARHATGVTTKSIQYNDLVSVVFTDPQIACVGQDEKQLKASGVDYVSADYPFDDHGKSMLMEAKHGYVRILADRSGRVLGAECTGKDAGELIHSMAVAVSLKANVRDLLGVHWYHPTLSEIWTYPLEEILEMIES